MYFTTAGIEVSWWIPPLVAAGVSFVTSMGGVSGAFLLLPFQMSVLGYTAPSVSATNQLFNIVAIPGGVYRYIREGRMVWPLAWVVVVGTLPGVLLGAVMRVAWLPDPKSFKLFAGLVLLYIGLRLVRDQLFKAGAVSRSWAEERFRELAQAHRARRREGEALPGVRVLSCTLSRIRYEFYGERYEFSTPGVLALSLAVGVVGGVYGIGGGAILAPFFVTFFGLPVYTVAGAALLGTFLTSVAGVAFYWAIAPLYPGLSVAPDWGLGILFGLGGMAGMYLGACCQKLVPARHIRWLLAGAITFTAVRYVLGFFAA